MTQEELKEIIDNPKMFLRQGINTKKLIAMKQDRIKSWRRLAESTAVPTDKNKSGSIRLAQKDRLLEDTISEIDTLETEIYEEIRELVEIERRVKAAIDLLAYDERHKILLEMRYLNGYSWKMIGSKMHYGEDWICRLHGVALMALKQHAEKMTV